MRYLWVLMVLSLVNSSAYAQQNPDKDTGVERKNYAALGAPAGPYSHAVKHADTLYLSGLTAYGTPAATEGIGPQVKAIFKQLELIASAEGSSLENLLKVTVFVTDLSEVAQLRTALFDVYGSHIPASSLVQVVGLFAPELKVEIEAVIAL